MVVGFTISARPRQPASRTINRSPGARRRHAASMVALVILTGPSLMTFIARSALTQAFRSDRTLTGQTEREQEGVRGGRRSARLPCLLGFSDICGAVRGSAKPGGSCDPHTLN